MLGCAREAWADGIDHSTAPPTAGRRLQLVNPDATFVIGFEGEAWVTDHAAVIVKGELVTEGSAPASMDILVLRRPWEYAIERKTGALCNIAQIKTDVAAAASGSQHQKITVEYELLPRFATGFDTQTFMKDPVRLNAELWTNSSKSEVGSSTGSEATHALGTCKPCLFARSGARCPTYPCEFCHLTHPRREGRIGKKRRDQAKRILARAYEPNPDVYEDIMEHLGPFQVDAPRVASPVKVDVRGLTCVPPGERPASQEAVPLPFGYRSAWEAQAHVVFLTERRLEAVPLQRGY